MLRIVPLLALMLFACPAGAQNWAADILQAHNAERARWSVPPLTWDLGLAAGADRWAAELARTNRWEHSPRQQRPGQGENLWTGTSGAYSVGAMVGAWLNERRWFRPGTFPAVSTTGNWTHVGHYTQIISRRSERMGCAIRSNARWTYLVCRYSPSGNVDGLRLP